MKRQMKIAAVVSATALLAIGASFTSMAATKTGTWVPEDDSYRCYDKNGDYYENEFCYDGATEFYVGEDGYLVRDSWVEYNDNMYYIQSNGTKTINAWKELTPYEDEDADTEWYYFGAAGKRVENAKKAISSDVYGTETFYFDGEGRVIYGWVEKTANGYEQADSKEEITSLVYTNERGARVEKTWFEAYDPTVNVEEDDLDGISKHWYYVKALGTPVTGKQANVTNATYLFNKYGEMLEGWVACVDGEYKAIGIKDYAVSLAQHTLDGDTIYYTCPEDGHVKKDQWIKDYPNTKFYEADPDGTTYWYYLLKDGSVFVPTASNASSTCVATDANAVDFTEGVLTLDDPINGAMLKLIDNNKYLFNANGQMQSGLKYFGGNYYYFGKDDDGAMKYGAQTIADSYKDDYKFFFGTEDSAQEFYTKGAGVTGNANGKLYINGLLEVADNEYKYELVPTANGTFIVNKSGSIQTSTSDYKDDGEVIIDLTDVTFVKTAGAKKGSVASGTVTAK